MIPHHCSKYDDGPLAAPPSTDELVSVSATTKLKILRSKILQQITNTATSQSSHSIGQITLLLVAFLYGTLNSTLRAIYAMDGKPVPSVLSFVRQLLSVVTFLPMILVARTKHSNTPIEKKEEDDVSLSLSKKDISSRRGQMSHPVWRSALELAFWNFGAQVRREKYVSFFIQPCYSLVVSSRIILIYSLITKKYYLGSYQCGSSPHFCGAGILFNADQRCYDTFSLSNLWRTHSNICLVWMWTCPKWAIFDSNRCNTNDGNISRRNKNCIFKLQPWRHHDTTWRIVVVNVHLPNNQTGTLSSCI